MQRPAANGQQIEVQDFVPRLGAAKQLATDTSTTSNRVALTAGTRRVSICARGADQRFALGTGAVTVSASASHFLGQGERIDIGLDPASETNIAGIIAASVSGVSAAALEITELLSPATV